MISRRIYKPCRERGKDSLARKKLFRTIKTIESLYNCSLNINILKIQLFKNKTCLLFDILTYMVTNF